MCLPNVGYAKNFESNKAQTILGIKMTQLDVKPCYSVSNERNFFAHSVLQNSPFLVSDLLQIKQNLIPDMTF